MKNLIIFCSLLIMTACAGAYKTSSGGKEDVGFISIVGDPKKYQAGVMVSIDENQPSIVEVVVDGKLTKTDSRMKVPTGKHSVKVTYQNKILYSENMIFFVQETKKINLP